MTGGLLILVLICSVSSTCESQSTPLTKEDLQHLGNLLADDGDDFGAYLFKVASYHLAEDNLAKLRLGHEVVDLCLRASRHTEAERMITTIAEDFPEERDSRNSLIYRYGYALVLAGQSGRGDLYLRQLVEEPQFKDRSLFLRALGRLIDSRDQDARQFLQRIDLDTFPYADSVESVVRLIDRGPSFHKKHKLVAGVMSGCVPGLGQVYTGHHFDALNSAIFNLAFGGAAYLSWKYEVTDREDGDRHYAIPILYTIVWSVFYIANIWNAPNGANRYNRFKEMEYYDGMVDKFGVCWTDRDYFLDVPWNPAP